MPKLKKLLISCSYLFLLFGILAVPPAMAQSTLSPKGILAFWLSPELDFNGDGKGNSLDLGDLISPALPDLIVVSSQPLGEIKPGVTPTGFSVEIENIGKATAIDPQNVVAFRLRKVTEGTDRGPIICNVKLRNINLNLDPGQTATFEGSGVELANLGDCPVYEVGEYQLDTFVDSFKTVKEGNEENNSTITPFTVVDADLPDLVVTNTELKGNHRPGGLIGIAPNFFAIEIKNQGQIKASASTARAEFELSYTDPQTNQTQVVCTPTISTNIQLNPGGSAIFEGRSVSNLDCPNFAVGSYTLIGRADITNSVAESNESNNDKTVTFTVEEQTATPIPTQIPTSAPTPTPELMVDLMIDKVSKLPTSIQEGQPLSAVIVETKNIGQLAHNGQALTYSISVQRTATSAPLCSFRRTYSGLRIDPSKTHRLSIDGITSAECGAMSAGQRILRVTVDPSNTIVESNENNNTTDHTFTVTAGPTPTPRPTNTPSPTPTPQVDFRILSISHTPVNVPVGGKITDVDFFIYNSTQGSYSGKLILEALIYSSSPSNSHCLIQRTINNFNIGAQETIPENIGLSNCGSLASTPTTYTIKVTADSANQIPETDESNNFDTQSFTTLSDNYDLTVSGVDFSPRGIDVGGRIARVSASIINNGANTLSAPTVEYEFRVLRLTGIFDTEQHCRFLKNIPLTLNGNGSGVDVTFFEVTGSECGNLDREGSYRLELKIDSDNRIQETREDNNLGFEDFAIPDNCDFC